MLAYLIVAYDQPRLLRRLLDRLRSPVAATFLHLDAKSDITQFEGLAEPGVVLATRRITMWWGGWTHVRASIGLLRQALADPRPFTHFALMSGTDYPLARPEAMLDYLKAIDVEAIDCLRMPNVGTDKLLSRLAVRWIAGGDRAQGLRAKLTRRINTLLARLPPRDVLKTMGAMVPHAGSTWWVLTREGAQRAVAAFDAGGPAVWLMKTSFCPEEQFYASVIVATTPQDRIGSSLTFTDWSGRDVRSVPAVIDEGHVDALTRDGPSPEGRPWLFARKVDAMRDDLLDRIDAFADQRVLDPIAEKPLGYEEFNRKYADQAEGAEPA